MPTEHEIVLGFSHTVMIAATKQLCDYMSSLTQNAAPSRHRYVFECLVAAILHLHNKEIVHHDLVRRAIVIVANAFLHLPIFLLVSCLRFSLNVCAY